MPRPLLISRQSDYLFRVFDRNSHKDNSADPDQCGSTLFAKTGHVVFSNRMVKYNFEEHVATIHRPESTVQILPNTAKEAL